MKICCDETLTFGWSVGKVHSNRLTASFVVKAVFKLQPNAPAVWADEPEPLAPDIYVDDDDQKPLKYPRDLTPFKPRGEALLHATAHSAGKRPVSMLNVRFRIGDINKSLTVFGDREWKSQLFGGASVSPPKSFSNLPIDYALAFGGPNSTKNPAGKGAGSEAAPNIEFAHRPAKGPRDDADPAGFGPISASWMPRAKKNGTFDEKWKKERWPWLPADYDWGAFNAAPVDQQIEGYFRGDEAMEFDNLHAEHPTYRAKLPGVRARCFVEQLNEQKEPDFRETPLRLDTIWIDLNKEKLVLVWRGLHEIRHIKLEGVQNILVLAEPLVDFPKPAEAYRAVLVERLNAGQAEDAAEAAEEAAEAKALAEAEELDAAADAASDAAAEAAFAEAEKQVGQHEQDLLAQGMTLASDDFTSPPPTFDESMAQLDQMANELKGQLPLDQHAAIDEEVGEMRDALKELEDASAELDDDSWVRERVEKSIQDGNDLTEQDFGELDLSGLDFTEVDLSGSNLKDANLERAKLVGAKLVGVDLSGANLSGVDLTRADLTGADLTGTALAGAVFSATIFAGADLSGQDLAGVNLASCAGKGVDFSEANLEGASFVGSSFPGAAFSGCNLAQANFAKAVLTGAQFDGAKVMGADFTDADITGIHADSGADFSRAKFLRAKADGAIWETSTFHQADFTSASLNRAIFSGASLKEAAFDRVQAADSVFDDADLTKARMTRANLLRASLERAILRDASFESSNLYEAGLWDALTDGTDFRSAYLKGTSRG